MSTEKTENTAELRIARAGRRLAEAAEKLPRAPKRKKTRESDEKKFLAPADALAALSPEERDNLVEIPDACERPIMYMPPVHALRQGITLPLSATALITRKRTLILRARTDKRLGSAGAWDLFTTFTLAGECAEDSALRALREAGLPGLTPTLAAHFPAADAALAARGAARHGFQITLFLAVLPSGLYPQQTADARFLRVDEDELMGLSTGAPELLTPELVHIAESGRIFA